MVLFFVPSFFRFLFSAFLLFGFGVGCSLLKVGCPDLGGRVPKGLPPGLDCELGVLVGRLGPRMDEAGSCQKVSGLEFVGRVERLGGQVGEVGLGCLIFDPG